MSSSHHSPADARPKRSVAAGFGSPADDATVHRIDLNEELIRHPDATFPMRAAGDGMRDAGIGHDDTLVVDRAITATPGHVVVAIVEGELVCRLLVREEGRIRLRAANPEFKDIVISQTSPLEVWGVVTHVIKAFQV